MYLVTRQSLANKAAASWKTQYPALLGHHHNTYEKLMGLGPTPDPDAVDAIIGNGTWTCTPSCQGCGASPDELVCFDYDSEYSDFVHVARICKECLAKALEL